MDGAKSRLFPEGNRRDLSDMILGLKRRSFLISAGTLITSGLALSGYARFIEPYSVVIERETLTFKELPEDFSGFTIALVTDLHHSRYVGTDYLKDVVVKVNRLKPDLILALGDYIYDDKKYIKPCFKIMKDLKAEYGIYGVLGNHDHWIGSKLVRKEMIKSDITDLTNRSIKIFRDKSYTEKDKEEQSYGSNSSPDISMKEKSYIRLIGAGDWWEEPSDAEKLLSPYSSDEFKIVLSHNPEWAEEIGNGMVNLVVSGHTHGGQVILPLIGAPILPTRYGDKYCKGLIKQKDFWVYVSRGIGMIFVPVRFNCQPEITLLTLMKG